MDRGLTEQDLRFYLEKEQNYAYTPSSNLPNLKRNRIAFDIYNPTLFTQEIPLFSSPFGSNEQQGISYGDLLLSFYSSIEISASVVDKKTVRVEYLHENGITYTTTPQTVNDIDEFITYLEDQLKNNFNYIQVGTEDFIVYKEKNDTYFNFSPSPNGNLIPTYSSNNLINLQVGNPVNQTILWNTFQVQSSSGIQISDLIGDLTYAELVSELNESITPYMFDFISVYADNVTQVNKPIKLKIGSSSGYKTVDIRKPAIPSTDSSNVVLNIPLNYCPNPNSDLIYTVGSGETVRMVINYKQGDVYRYANKIQSEMNKGLTFKQATNKTRVSFDQSDLKYIQGLDLSKWNFDTEVPESQIKKLVKRYVKS